MSPLEAAEALEPIWIFLDETQRDLPDTPDGVSQTLTAVAGVAISSHERVNVERAMVQTHSDILATPRFWYDGDPERKKRFRKALHATEANDLIMEHIRNQVLHLPFRTHLAHSTHSSDENKLVRFALLYNSILCKLIKRYGQRSMFLVFERHTELDRHFETIVKSACRIASDHRPIRRLGSKGVKQDQIAPSPQIVLARGDKATPGCALADLMLYVFGDAVLAGLRDASIQDASEAHVIRRWTSDLASRVAYEYDYDRDEHNSGRGGRSQVSSY